MKAPRRGVIYVFGTVFICVLLAAAVFAYAVYAANAAAPTRPLVLIKSTVPENAGVTGQPLVVFAQARDPDGIAQVELWVNGQQVAAQDNPEKASHLPFETSQAWIPDGAGNYLVVMKATDREGFLGQSDPFAIQVQDRTIGVDPSLIGEYAVQAGDTWESIAASFGTTPEDLHAHNPDLGELIPGATVRLPPPPEGAAESDDGATPPAGLGDVPHVGAPLPPPLPGGEIDADPRAGDWWDGFLPLPLGFDCLINPELCAPTGGGAGLRPFPPPSDVGAADVPGCSIDVSWTDTSENEQGFRVYRFASRPRFRMDLLEIVGPGVGSGMRLLVRDTTPPRGELFYAVAAYNAGGDIWSGPSANVVGVGCAPHASADQALVVEGLAIEVRESFDRLYCYASLADSPFERIPHGTSSFITLEAGIWNIAEHFSGVNKREVMAPAGGPLIVVLECMGWQGDALINLGRFRSSHSPAEWDGRSLITGLGTEAFTVTYRINYSFRAADEGGRAAWPLVDPSIPVPYNLRVADEWRRCTFPAGGGWPTCEAVREPGLTWQDDSISVAPYKVYRRLPSGSVPVRYYETWTSAQSAPLAMDNCHETVFYSVSRAPFSDPITREDIESPLSEELEVPATCTASLEITLVRLSVADVDDGDSHYEAYGWFEFNGRLIRWNDHCDGGLFTGCIYFPPSYEEVGEFSQNSWTGFMLNTGDGWRRNNNVIRIPIRDGEPLTLRFALWDHDNVEDEAWCGFTAGGAILGGSQILAEARTVSQWLDFDRPIQFGPPGNGDHCNVLLQVRGVPGD